MKKKIAFAMMMTALLFMAPSLAFSQDNRGGKQQENVVKKCAIGEVTPNLAHQSISITLQNLDPENDCRMLLYNGEGEMVNSFWIDADAMTLYVGAISPGDYELVLVKDKATIDRRQVTLQ